jgi:ankyrin repeat protein
VYAVIGGSIEIIRLLQDRIQYEKALIASIEYHQYEVFEWIDQTLPNPLDQTALEQALGTATIHNNLHAFEYYKDRLNGTEPFLQNLLHQAFVNCHREIIFYLLEIIEVRLEMSVLNRCLSIAAAGCPVDVVSTLVTEYHCDVNSHCEGFAPLQIAAKGGFLELVKYFARHPNIDINAATEIAAPALHQAANEGLSEIVAFLLTVDGIDVNAQDTKGFTALHCAARWNQMDVVRLLLQVPGIDLTIVEDRTVFLMLFCKPLFMWQ